MINRKVFYDDVRVSLFKGHLAQSQVDGIGAIFDEWEKRQLSDLRWLAYMLATVFYETDKTMQPVEENGKGKGRRYGQRLKMDGSPYAEPFVYYGRGLTQNTWWEIYKMLTIESAKQGHKWDFINHPELLLQMEPSIWATFYCMINGKYTGVGLKKYFNDVTCDWVNARRIINSLDKARKIADYALDFYKAIS